MRFPLLSQLLIAIVVSVVSATTHAAAQPSHDELSAHLDPFRGDRPGIAAMVLKDGEVVFAEAAGLANLETGESFTLDTPIQTGSLAKQFTAYAVALLEQEGKLSFGDEVSTYIQELPAYPQQLTIAHLLHHQSGLRDQWGAFWMAGYVPSDLPEQDAMIRFITKQQSLDFDPGTEYNYSNSNYTLLAEIIERVSGMSYPRFMAERVFGPLGMASTEAVSEAFSQPKNEALSYAPAEDGGFDRVPYAAETFGPHNIVSTARDLGRWLSQFEDETGTARSFIADMSAPARLANGHETIYGMGLIDFEWLGARHVHHFGVDAGYRAYIGTYPEAGAGIVLLANSSDANLPDLSRELAVAAFPDALAWERDEDKAAAPLPASLASRLEGQWRVVSGPALRANRHPYEGPFGVVGGPLVTISRDGEGLAIGSAWSPPLPFEEGEDGRVAVKTRMGDIVLETENLRRGPINELVLRQYGETRLIRAKKAGSANLAGYEGRYFSDELETFYDVKEEDGKLVLSQIRTGTVTLEPEGPEGRFTGPWIYGAVQFETRGGEEMMLISYGRAKQIPFRKISSGGR
ncbi:MAG: serine hydrolase domain-containing protein [Parvularcula sp.]|jgi:CubicO group peptidase (beta-lactamase class C family)|nr:serine hydrolase domain-containing protein [Parvularcula sp.]